MKERADIKGFIKKETELSSEMYADSEAFCKDKGKERVVKKHPLIEREQ